MSGWSKLGLALLLAASATVVSAEPSSGSAASERFRVTAQAEPRYSSADGRFGASARVSADAVVSNQDRFSVTPKRSADCDPNGDTIFANGFE